MKVFSLFLIFISLLLTGFRDIPDQGENVEFSCMKTHKATNTCHFNFIIDGAKYRYLDIGCKFSKKRDDVIKKAKAGSLALAKDWKIECDPKSSAAGTDR